MTPIKYIGNVKRIDIKFDIRHREKEKAYREEKLEVATAAIEDYQRKGEKTLVYVPYTKHVSELMSKIDDTSEIGRYFGGLPAGEKEETLQDIKNGKKKIVIATKAFGMGIDIDDIKNVYHFAPTGNVADYVQEIGRAARQKDMIGFASTDFYKEDFRYVNQLYGMSSIKNHQIKAVLHKIFELYNKYNRRNFLVAPEEFSYVFADVEPQDVDAKLKTALLIIKKDFELDRSINFVPLIFKPRSMFTHGYFMVHDDFIKILDNLDLLKYFKKHDYPRTYEYPDSRGIIVHHSNPGDTYSVDFKRLWEDRYKDISFGMFKHQFYKNELPGFDFLVGEKLVQRVILEIQSSKFFSDVKLEFIDFLDDLKDILDDLRQNGSHFGTDELARKILDKTSVSKRYVSEMLSTSIIPLLQRIEVRGLNFNNRFVEYNQVTNKYVIKNTTYEQRINILKRTIRNMLANDQQKSTVRYSNRLNDNKEIVVAQILEILEIINSKISSGANPEFFVRVNNPYAIEKIIRNPDYRSRTVSLVGQKHIESCKLMNHFFTKLNSDEERWDFIEKYFLGKLDIKSIVYPEENQTVAESNGT